MSVSFKGKRIRLELNAASTALAVDKLLGSSPSLWRGTNAQFDLGLFYDVELIKVEEYASITLEVFASTRSGAPFMSATVANADLNAALTKEQWEAGTHQHCSIPFTFAETNLTGSAAGTPYWLVISAVTTDTPERRVTLGCATLTVIEDGTPASTEGPLQSGNLIPSDAEYDGSGEYEVTVVAGRTYKWTKLANDDELDNDGEVLSASGHFDAATTTVVLTGTPSEPVTAIIWSEVFLTAAEMAGRYLEASAANLRNLKSANLSDVASVSTARDNLDVYSKGTVDTAVGAKLAKSANLSDVTNAATARDNLDVYSKGTVDTAVGAKMAKSANLSDVGSVSTARTNLDVPSNADLTDGLAEKLAIDQNLADVDNVVTARANLGVKSEADTDTAVDERLEKTENLNDLDDKADARTNLQVPYIGGDTFTGDVEINSTAGLPLELQLTDAGALSSMGIVGVCRRISSDGPAASGYGVSWTYQAHDASGTISNIGRVGFQWLNPVTRESVLIISPVSGASYSGVLTVDSKSNIGTAVVGSPPTGLIGGFWSCSATAPSTDPTNGGVLVAPTGEGWLYRTDAASEGAGATNHLHNRAIETAISNVGGNYSLTNSFALVQLTGGDMRITLPTAGTYLLLAEVMILSTTIGDVLSIQLRDETASADISGVASIQQPVANQICRLHHHQNFTATSANKVVAVWARNGTAARGTVQAGSANVLTAVRLF